MISMQDTVTGTGAHTAASGATGAASVGYYANDMVAKQSQGTTTIAFGLSPVQDRIASQTTTVTGGTKPGTTVTTNHYDSGSDSPAWIDTVATPTGGAASTTWARNITGPAGGLVAQITGTGTAAPAAGAGTATCSLQIANLHGDVVTTLPATTTSTLADFTTGFTQTTEYGVPRSAGKTTSNTGAYGWVGAHIRSGDDLAGLILMGARLYNPSTGRFLSVDPVYGGNDNAYNYPGDPILLYDLNGLWWHFLSQAAHAIGHATKAVGHEVVKHRGVLASLAAGGVCMASAGIACGAAVVFAAAVGTQQRHAHHLKSKAALKDFAIGAGLGLASWGLTAGIGSLYRSAGVSPFHWSALEAGLGVTVAGLGYGGVRDKRHGR